MKISPFVRFLEILEGQAEVGAEFFENKLQHDRSDFLERRWIRVTGYADYVTVDFFGDEIEVAVEIDLAAGLYRYQNPEHRHHTVESDLWEISRFRLNLEQWLDDLSRLIAVQRHSHSSRREVIPGHLWHLGQQALGTGLPTIELFVARCSEPGVIERIEAKVSDWAEPGHAVVFVDDANASKAFGEHVARCLSDLVEFDGIKSSFNREAMARTIRRHAVARELTTPDEYLEEKLLKLAHMDEPIRLTEEQYKIVSFAWGSPQKDPPIVSWKEVVASVNTGYTSFDDAFGSSERREAIFQRVDRGQYRIWRGKNRKTINKTIDGAINRP